MKKFLSSFSVGLLFLFYIGGMLIYMTSGLFFTSLRPATSFEDLQETTAKAGMHIKGNVPLAYDCFAYEETWKEGNNQNGVKTRTPAKTSKYYYAIPVGDKILALEMPVDSYKDMEKLADETQDYLANGGQKPTVEVFVDGRISKMDDSMQKLFREYLGKIGYTSDEINDMNTVYYIEHPHSMATMRVMFLIGIAIILLGIFILLHKYKSNSVSSQTRITLH